MCFYRWKCQFYRHVVVIFLEKMWLFWETLNNIHYLSFLSFWIENSRFRSMKMLLSNNCYSLSSDQIMTINLPIMRLLNIRFSAFTCSSHLLLQFSCRLLQIFPSRGGLYSMHAQLILFHYYLNQSYHFIIIKPKIYSVPCLAMAIPKTIHLKLFI